ncbi:MAG TPA: hypothetical protein VE988_25085 [Gemmataceae bacterium]|nr:hypothetical protein [Gemmataceae bacterium]
MTVQVPEWLVRRGGDLKLASDGKSRFVMLGGEPVYTLAPRPASGKFGCAIKQTNSGRPIACASVADNEEGALGVGLEELRKTLGW